LKGTSKLPTLANTFNYKQKDFPCKEDICINAVG